MNLLSKLSMAAFAVLLFGAIALLAQNQPTTEEQAELMAKMQELAQPGPEHKELAKIEGKWEYTARMWMSPGADNPLVSEGTCENKMIIGGRFLETDFTGAVMGHSFEGKSIFGFDRRSEEYTTVGFDNTGTYWVSAKGPMNKQTGEVVMTGTDYDPIGKFTQEYKFIMYIKDKDSYSFRVVFTDPVMSQGTGEFKMVEIEYSREKE